MSPGSFKHRHRYQQRECPKCGWQWIPRTPNPRRCPRCGKWFMPKPRGT